MTRYVPCFHSLTLSGNIKGPGTEFHAGFQLWKRLFLRRFGNGRQRANSAFFVSPLFPPSQRQRTWKELFKVSYNWTTGNARTTQLSLRSSVLPNIPSTLLIDGDECLETVHDSSPGLAAQDQLSSLCHREAFPGIEANRGGPDTLLVWHGQFYFVAKRRTSLPNGIPVISVHVSPPRQATRSTDLSCVAQVSSPGLLAMNPSEPLGIAEMQLDELPYSNQTGIRLAVFYTSGQYSIFCLQNLHHSANAPFQYGEEYFGSSIPSKPTVHARFHSPLLVTSAIDCSIRFHLLEERTQIGTDSEDLVITQSQPIMRSHLCYAPMVMRLEPIISTSLPGFPLTKDTRDFRLSLAYSTPYYPAAFTVGVHVFDIHIPSSKRRYATSSSSHIRSPRLEVLARSAIAAPPITAPRSPSAGSHTPAVAQTQAVVTSIEHDGPYVVTSKSDNTIAVYEVKDALRRYPGTRARKMIYGGQFEQPPSPATMASIPLLRIRQVKTLFGHTASVDAVSVLDGRCVSTGRDGVKVWELPGVHNSASIDFATTSSALDLEEEDIWQADVQVREDRSSSSLDSGSPPTSPLHGRCKWLGLDASKIVTVCSDDSGQAESVKVYDFE